MNAKEQARRLLKEPKDFGGLEELSAILEEAEESRDVDKKLPEKTVQSVSLVLGIVLFLGVQAEWVKTEVPDWIYIMFLGGFLSGYDALFFMPLIRKIKDSKDD